jgi:hypothetical protein
MKRLAFIFFLTILSIVAYSQKIRNASGMAQFRLEEDMSKDDLKEKLRHHAIINAIEREYGTYVTQESFVDIDDGGTKFKIFGKSVIQGEWLKTTNEDFKEEFRKNKDGRRNKNELWMSLKIQGMVRELTQPDIAFDFFTTNCRREVCKTAIFESGEPMYVHFKTPVKGFLSIYAIENDKALRLLPYQSMPATYINAVPVEADREYVFFSPYGENDYFSDFSNLLIDELVMLTEQDMEYLQLYFVFSTEEYQKPGLAVNVTGDNSGYDIPKSLNASDLNSWLESNRINNVNFYYKQMKVKIVK